MQGGIARAEAIDSGGGSLEPSSEPIVEIVEQADALEQPESAAVAQPATAEDTQGTAQLQAVVEPESQVQPESVAVDSDAAETAVQTATTQDAPAVLDDPEAQPTAGTQDSADAADTQAPADSADTQSPANAADAQAPAENPVDASQSDAPTSPVANGTSAPSQPDERKAEQNAVAPAAVADAQPSNALPTGSDVYVNGQSGSDDNPGTAGAPVKTFDKAKELLGQTGGKIIYVTGEISPQKDGETWSLSDGQELKRDKNYHGNLINVTHGLTLQGITVDGGSDDGASGIATGDHGNGGSLAYVGSGKTLTVADGATLQNNKIESKGNWYPEAGGGVFVDGGTLNITGGTIQNNEAVWGGGVYGIYGATINMSGGTIQNNKAVKDNSRKNSGGCGGGACLATNAKMNLSGGTIKGNTAWLYGGGISVGPDVDFEQGKPTLSMTGGTVDSNTSDGTGGGIFVQAGATRTSYGVATISAGNITNNSSLGKRSNSDFGGGGIYVNGGTQLNGSRIAHNGELHITNVVISDNTAKQEGGGFAGCPSSKTEIHLSNGAAIYGNSASDNSEVYLMAGTHGSWRGTAKHEISIDMLGGGTYGWKYSDGSEMPLAALSGNTPNTGLSLDNAPSDATIAQALALGKVLITGNHSATRGGGIGSNGSVFMGTSDDTTQIGIQKLWNDGQNAWSTRPDKVKIELNRDGEYVGFIVVTGERSGSNPWKAVFKNLPKVAPDGHEYAYTVKERAVAGYSSQTSGSAADGFTITNTALTSVSGSKTWDDNNNQDGMRPDHITIRLFADGAEVASKDVIEGEDGAWNWEFAELPRYAEDGHEIAYTVSEDEVPGYTTQASEAKMTIGSKKVLTGKYDKDTSGYDSLVVRLLTKLPDWKVVATQTISAENGWAWRFEDMPEVDENGMKVEYYCAFYASDDAVTYDWLAWPTRVTNVNWLRTATGSLAWTDTNGQDARPQSITVHLLANGKEIASKDVTAADGWAWSFEDLPWAENDVDINYTFALDGYEDAHPMYYITNKHVPEVLGITVTKKWVGTPAGPVTVHLFADGEDTGQTLVLSADGDWKGAFANLAKFKAGKAIAYTVSEDAIAGYTTEVSGDAENGFVITNTKPKEDKPKETPKKDTPKETPKKQTPKETAKPSVHEASKAVTPGTGDASVAPVVGTLSVLGLALLAIAFLARKRSATKHE